MKAKRRARGRRDRRDRRDQWVQTLRSAKRKRLGQSRQKNRRMCINGGRVSSMCCPSDPHPVPQGKEHRPKVFVLGGLGRPNRRRELSHRAALCWRNSAMHRAKQIRTSRDTSREAATSFTHGNAGRPVLRGGRRAERIAGAEIYLRARHAGPGRNEGRECGLKCGPASNPRRQSDGKWTPVPKARGLDIVLTL